MRADLTEAGYGGPMPSARELIQTGLLGEALDPGPALIFIADDTMKYVVVNQLAAEVLGYTREELLQLRVTDVVHSPTAAAEYEQMMAQGQLTGTAVLTRKDGSEVTLHYRADTTRIAQMTFYVSVGFVEES
jgi:PAS domain S-box-containing protein